MRPEDAISLALLGLYDRRGSTEIGFRKDVLSFLQRELPDQVSPTGIRIRSTPRGAHSDEVSEFVGRLSLGGYLVQESPIRLTDDGVSLLRAHIARKISRDKDKEIARAVEVLRLTESINEVGARAPG
jgi:hypothetical protein